MQNVYIIDDDPGIRHSLTILFEAQGYTPHTYANGEMFLQSPLEVINGPVLLDVRMPGLNGLDVLTKALNINPGLGIIIMSGHADIPMAVRALKLGAHSFLEKPFKLTEILAEFSSIRERADTKKKNQLQQLNARQKLSALTPRETEIVQHLVIGKPNRTIADDLNISIRTVEAHRARLILKLGAKSLSDIVRMSLLAEGKIRD